MNPNKTPPKERTRGPAYAVCQRRHTVYQGRLREAGLGAQAEQAAFQRRGRLLCACLYVRGCELGLQSMQEGVPPACMDEALALQALCGTETYAELSRQTRLELHSLLTAVQENEYLSLYADLMLEALYDLQDMEQPYRCYMGYLDCTDALNTTGRRENASYTRALADVLGITDEYGEGV